MKDLASMMSPRKRTENGDEKINKELKKRKILRIEGTEDVSKLKWYSKLWILKDRHQVLSLSNCETVGIKKRSNTSRKKKKYQCTKDQELVLS